jgi:hypothetical protein
MQQFSNVSKYPCICKFNNGSHLRFTLNGKNGLTLNDTFYLMCASAHQNADLFIKDGLSVTYLMSSSAPDCRILRPKVHNFFKDRGQRFLRFQLRDPSTHLFLLLPPQFKTSRKTHIQAVRSLSTLFISVQDGGSVAAQTHRVSQVCGKPN